MQLRSGVWVDALIINGVRRGGEGGSLGHELRLGSGEYVTHIYLRSGDYVDHVEFVTNRGNGISGGIGGGSPARLENVKVLRIGAYLD